MVLWLKQVMLNLVNQWKSKDFNLSLAGTGGSDFPNLKAEFSDVAHERGEAYYLLRDHQIQIVLTVNFLFVSKPHLI